MLKNTLKLQVVVAITFICCAGVAAQTSVPVPFPPETSWGTPDEEIIKAAEEHFEKDLKDGFERRAEITIKASADKTRAWLTQIFTKYGYSVTKDSKDKLSFERKEGDVVVDGGTPRPRLLQRFQIISFKVLAKNEMTIVETDIKVDARINTGQYTRTDLNKQPAFRRWITYVLHNLQKSVEPQQGREDRMPNRRAL